MPNRQKHRGQHPKDKALFAPETHQRLREAGEDMQWLLSRGYPVKASLKIVGDQFRLQQRQRLALSRSVCSQKIAQARKRTMQIELPPSDATILVDGFNVLITLETLLSNGTLFCGQDGAYRDLASIHGSYHRVEETEPALLLLGRFLGNHSLHWFFDQPVSNSLRIVHHLRILAAQQGWAWKADVDYNPDRILAEANTYLLTTDGPILDHGSPWINLTEVLLLDRPNWDPRQLVQPPIVYF